MIHRKAFIGVGVLKEGVIVIELIASRKSVAIVINLPPAHEAEYSVYRVNLVGLAVGSYFPAPFSLFVVFPGVRSLHSTGRDICTGK